ncbi:TetR/AcrR family transcriptional regulator [Paramicrobacterium agarici]|uniref:TetR family transcriptional regulator n=1 Tax=Paramicrobacterium agarici TaxID=630514 RepID=A0A2A9DV22_9MICO|nr:TetR/AcrR family transcriptional regulator [Microbacterium agarici]PFG29759.1 TetR family transcriptional regulator [Microbacterium agarici]
MSTSENSDDSVPPRPRTARQRAREQITAEILAAARARLRDEGPAQLSLRAVARDVGMVSSAVYRYVASRDELLTALLTEAYNELGAVAEEADAAVSDRSDSAARWMTVCRAIRRWALQHPHDYALLYGTPVPGYAAPSATIEPATRTVRVLIGIVADAYRDDPTRAPAAPAVEGAPGSVGSAVESARAFLENTGAGVVAAPGSDALARLLMAWSSIFGTLSFELFGHFVGSVDDADAYFDAAMHRLALDLGLA